VAKKVSRASAKGQARPKWHAVPLKGSFMVMSILGILITLYLVEDMNYKVAFILIFAAMFIASFVSMSKAPLLQ